LSLDAYTSVLPSSLPAHAFPLPLPAPYAVERLCTREETSQRGCCVEGVAQTEYAPFLPFPSLSLPLPLLFPSMASVRAHAVRMCLPACSHSRITRRVPRAGTRDESANSTASADSASARCNPDVRVRRIEHILHDPRRWPRLPDPRYAYADRC
jgi:hypothetical protein